MEKTEKWLAVEDAAIAQFAPEVEDSLAAYMDSAITEFGRTGQFTEPGLAAVSQLVDVLGIGWATAIALGAEHQELLTKADLPTGRAVLEYTRTYGLSRARRVVKTTADQLYKLVLSGQRRGLSNVEIGKLLINKVPQIARTRAKIIAETEIHSAAQFGSYNAALRSGRSLIKTWNTVGDERVRDFRSGAQFSHRAMNQKTAALAKLFQVPARFGGAEGLLFPGDPNGSAGNIIHCRCFMTFEQV